MLTALKDFLRLLMAPTLYVGWIITIFVTIFQKVEWGLLLLVAMIPQPNIWYLLRGYPLGNNFIDLLVFAILLGIVFQGKGFSRAPSSLVIIAFVIISYLSLWNASFNFSLPIPFTTANALFPDWKNYAEMILLYFLVFNVLKDEDQHRVFVVLISVVILLIAIRSYRNFTGGASFDYDKRVGGPFEAVGLGANHFGAFIAYYCTLFLGLFFFDTNRKRRLLFLATYLFGLHPLFFSYSRGAYLGALGALAFMGVFTKRSLLIIVMVIVIGWQTLLPASVVDRIMMTESASGRLDESAASRLYVWEHAYELFHDNPIFGIGFGGFGFTMPAGGLTDTHNFYMKTLSEQGVIGIIMLIIVLLAALWSGWRLLRIGSTPFYKGLGFGFVGCVIALIISNIFGDRWSYFALGGYFWIFWGIVDRGILNSQNHSAAKEQQPLPTQTEVVLTNP